MSWLRKNLKYLLLLYDFVRSYSVFRIAQWKKQYLAGEKHNQPNVPELMGVVLSHRLESWPAEGESQNIGALSKRIIHQYSQTTGFIGPTQQGQSDHHNAIITKKGKEGKIGLKELDR